MPDLSVTVCGREFPISCGEGEEEQLLAAAALLDSESRALLKKDERLTEQKMLLMAGLILADRTTGLQRDLRIERQRGEGVGKGGWRSEGGTSGSHSGGLWIVCPKLLLVLKSWRRWLRKRLLLKSFRLR